MRPSTAPHTLTSRLAGRTVFVVSPHLDDAALSAWWLLTALDDVHVLDVFTAPSHDDAPSYWDVGQGFASSGEAIAARVAEDRRALARTKARSTHLGLRELEYRTDVEHASVAADVRRLVLDVVDGHPDAVVVIPAALGRRAGRVRRLRDRSRIPVIRTVAGERQHRDHRIVRDALLDLRRAVGIEVACYEDLPYARSGGRDELQRALEAAGAELRPVDVWVDLGAKEQTLRAYESQFATFLPSWAPFARAFAATERYWWPVSD